MAIKYKISLLPCLLILALMAIGGNTYINLITISEKTRLTAEIFAKEAEISSSIMENTLQRKLIVYQYLREQTPNIIKQYEQLEEEFLDYKAAYLKLDIAQEKIDELINISELSERVDKLFLEHLQSNSKKIRTNNKTMIDQVTPALIDEILYIRYLADIKGFSEVFQVASELVLSTMNARSYMQNYVLYNQQADSERFLAAVEQSEALYRQIAELLEGEGFDENMSNVDKLLNEIKIMFHETSQVIVANNNLLSEELEPSADQIVSLLASNNKLVWSSLERNGKEVNKTIEDINRTNIIVSTILVVVSVLLLVLVISRILKPLNIMLESMNKISKGDLRARIQVDIDDEIGSFAKDFNQFMEKLHRVILNLSETAQGVLSASQGVSKEASVCEEGISQQRSETEQAATAINEMAQTSAEVARSTETTLNSIQVAKSSIKDGESAVSRSANGIHSLADNINEAFICTQELTQKSSNVATILSTINAITDQTNLLALNAAIEAARAGDYGRGFSVVADEVRTLAVRTHQATDEIQKIITELQTSTNKTEQMLNSSNEGAILSVTQVEAVDESFKSITNSISSIDEGMCQIASAMVQQAATTKEINRNVTQVNEISIDNLDSIKTTANNSNNLLTQVNNINQLIAEFSL